MPCWTAETSPPRRVMVRGGKAVAVWEAWGAELCRRGMSGGRGGGVALDGALEVLGGDHGVGFVVLFGDALLDGGDESAEAGHGARGQCGGGLGIVEGEFF